MESVASDLARLGFYLNPDAVQRDRSPASYATYANSKSELRTI